MHLKRETALDLIEGRLLKQLTQQWMGHLATCSRCATEVERCRALLTSLKRSHLQSAPDSLLESVIALYQRPAERAQRSSIRQVIASLIYDSFSHPAFAGARGEAAARHAVLRADEFDIHVRVWEAGERRELMGQISSCRSRSFVDTARLHLLRDGERISSAYANDLGEFLFTYVPDGCFSLQVDLPHLTVIGALDLNSPVH